MSDHLPECCVGKDDCSATPCQRCHACCICEQLRACEERMREEERSWEGAVLLARAGYQAGYHAAIQDARDAVENQPDIIFRGAAWVKHEPALFAIDGLREKQ